MTAIQVGTLSYKMGCVTFIIERQDVEMYPGCESEVVVVDYTVSSQKSEAGVCLK